MFFVIFISVLTVASFIYAMRKQRPLVLFIPFLSLFVYIVIEIAAVPAPFIETVKFIFSLQ